MPMDVPLFARAFQQLELRNIYEVMWLYMEEKDDLVSFSHLSCESGWTEKKTELLKDVSLYLALHLFEGRLRGRGTCEQANLKKRM